MTGSGIRTDGTAGKQQGVPLPPPRPSRDGGDARPESGTYANLIGVAAELFGEIGYERTTVREISKRMGLQSGSLYSHISSKDEILEEIALRVGEEYLSRAKAAIERCDDPEQALRELITQHLTLMHEYPQAVTVYFNEWRKLDETRRQAIRSLRRDYERIFEGVISEGIRRGKFRDVDVRLSVLFIESVLNWTYQWYSPKGRYSPRKLAEAYADLYLVGLQT